MVVWDFWTINSRSNHVESCWIPVSKSSTYRSEFFKKLPHLFSNHSFHGTSVLSSGMIHNMKLYLKWPRNTWPWNQPTTNYSKLLEALDQKPTIFIHIQVNSYHIQVIFWQQLALLVSKHLKKKVCILTNGIIRIELIRDIGMIIPRHTLAVARAMGTCHLEMRYPWFINSTQSVPLDV